MTVVFFVVEDVFLAALTNAAAVFSALAVFDLEETIATIPATAPTTPTTAATVVFLIVVVEVFLVLLFLLLDELPEMLDEEELVPSYFAHCFMVSLTFTADPCAIRSNRRFTHGCFREHKLACNQLFATHVEVVLCARPRFIHEF